MPRNRGDDRQQQLPLREAEGIDAERRARWSLRRSTIYGVAAVHKIKLAERELMIWIALMEDYGDGLLLKTMEEIAAYGDGLCCDVKTARKIVHRLLERGWILNEEQIDAKPLKLRIDWSALRVAGDVEAQRKPSQNW